MIDADDITRLLHVGIGNTPWATRSRCSTALSDIRHSTGRPWPRRGLAGEGANRDEGDIPFIKTYAEDFAAIVVYQGWRLSWTRSGRMDLLPGITVTPTGCMSGVADVDCHRQQDPDREP